MLKAEECFTDDKTFQQALQHIMIIVADDWTKHRVNKECARIHVHQKWVPTPLKLNIYEEFFVA